MATARQDFERFVGWLYHDDMQVPADVRRLAHLALENFDTLAGTSRQRSQRASYLVELVRDRLTQTADTPPQPQPDGVVDAWPWARLSHLTLGPFRGFRNPEPFDLDNQIVLFYGPNGSGKTSLCEGLEYSLLGEVEEAGAKRIAARTYLSNVHAQYFEPPILKATDHQDQEIDVVANADIYRFCFIEKNRIDAFSRIAARPNNQRAELIATLFGMDQFNDFVSHFNGSIDGQLVLSSAKQTKLEELRSALETDKATVDGEADRRHRLRYEEAELAMSYSEGTDYAGLKELIGSAEAPGRLQELNSLLDVVPPPIIGVKRQTILDAFERAHQCQKNFDEITLELQAQSDQVSFKALYDAVLALQQTVGDRCPACDTPLKGAVHVVANPYEKATTGLADLLSLSELQQQQHNAQQDLTQASRVLRQMMTHLENFIDQQQEKPSVAKQFLSGLVSEPEGIWWATLYPQSEGENAESDLLDQLLGIAADIETQDTLSQKMQQEREPLVAERQRLLDFQLKVQAQDQKDLDLTDAIEKATARISEFDTENAELIALAKQEEQNIIRDTGIKETYDRFLEELKSYREQLPGQFLAGLNEMALILYNEFNQNDLDADKLASLHLPLTSEDKIEVAFRGNPEQSVDALHVLSEGHIRCLGLAILMAKAKSMRSPLIVFDDAINAIDHDHRRGIRETIFESEHFVRTQIIVTCHSNEFIKDIQQHLPRPRREDCQVYLLKHHTGDNQPRVVNNVATRNYIEKARVARETLNDREALSESRRALEMLSNKVWQWLGYHELGLLTVQLTRAGAEPNLRNLCDALLKKLRKARTFDHINKDPLIEAYGRITAISESNMIWTYLNKGTHEEADRDDFDSDDVESVVQTLEQIDRLDLRRPR